MLYELGITKLSKYHFYKNEIKNLNKYKNEILSKFGSLENLPIQVHYCYEREKSRVERYAKENCIHDISEEILSANNTEYTIQNQSVKE